MKKQYTIQKGRGNYYRALTFHYSITLIIMIPLVILAFLTISNPFWFRQAAANKFSDLCIKLHNWRGYTTYKIYLGADPTVWHALKD